MSTLEEIEAEEREINKRLAYMDRQEGLRKKKENIKQAQAQHVDKDKTGMELKQEHEAFQNDDALQSDEALQNAYRTPHESPEATEHESNLSELPERERRPYDNTEENQQPQARAAHHGWTPAGYLRPYVEDVQERAPAPLQLFPAEQQAGYTQSYVQPSPDVPQGPNAMFDAGQRFSLATPESAVPHDRVARAVPVNEAPAAQSLPSGLFDLFNQDPVNTLQHHAVAGNNEAKEQPNAVENSDDTVLFPPNRKYEHNPNFTSLIRKPDGTAFWELRCFVCGGNIAKNKKRDRLFVGISGFRNHISVCHPNDLENGRISTGNIIAKCNHRELTIQEVDDMTYGRKGAYQIEKISGAAAHAESVVKQPHPWKKRKAGDQPGEEINVKKRASKAAGKKQKQKKNVESPSEDWFPG